MDSNSRYQGQLKMSFINLLANDVWSEQDIINRTEAIIRSEFSIQAELILNRKIIGQITNAYVLSEQEMTELDHYKSVVESARLAGIDARKDMALLAQVFAFEKIAERLKQPIPEQIVVDQEITNQAEIDADYAEREAIKKELDSMSIDVRSLYDLRNPAIVVPVELPTEEIPPLQIPVVEHPVE